MAILLLTSLILFSFFPISTLLPPCPETIPNAIAALSNSSYVSMALTLQLLCRTLDVRSSSATIFSPSDDAFIRSGQPSLSLLLYHFSPQRLSIANLSSLAFGNKIPTLSDHSLIVTTSTSDPQTSLNDVKINESSIYDDGSLVIYGIDDFLDPSYQLPFSSVPEPNSLASACTVTPDVHDHSSTSEAGGSFSAASKLLLSRGYSVMATFLDLQLIDLKAQMKLTVFAPIDEAMEERLGSYREYSSVFLRHVLPCRLTWTDLTGLDDRTVLQTFSKGFTISITATGDTLMINGVPVIFPDMYYSDWLVIHGLRQMLIFPEKQPPTGDSFFAFNGAEEESTPDFGGFHR
ncbi:PREDICTED: putative fasciclin-like arabinogalactan protein 20 [Nelumbo nucifera]|uniref:FAS1 domain-containing protein n=2 Tax=Nelumbo nucifera TaxID=4432 RepID=A0A822YS56_NELNU|nr:PREDICTED: putative fasciclin-like arabinogalactan protein 20 [Nelumbo nucifera]DAD34249.1 TPA_asm: hypothetical protein HUJ06_004889 [Nelumbo nucifera]